MCFTRTYQVCGVGTFHSQYTNASNSSRIPMFQAGLRICSPVERIGSSWGRALTHTIYKGIATKCTSLCRDGLQKVHKDATRIPYSFIPGFQEDQMSSSHPPHLHPFPVISCNGRSSFSHRSHNMANIHSNTFGYWKEFYHISWLLNLFMQYQVPLQVFQIKAESIFPSNCF